MNFGDFFFVNFVIFCEFRDFNIFCNFTAFCIFCDFCDFSNYRRHLVVILGTFWTKIDFPLQFKLIVNLIGFVLSCTNLYIQYRVLDLLFMFLIVWYYCTLTIRESILRVNGSRIKGWWRAHHFITTIVGGVLLVWPDGNCYQTFRPQLMWFNVYLAFLQYLQFTYQRGVLYRLRSLGERNDMDITIDGFHSWMWKGRKYKKTANKKFSHLPNF